MGSALVKHESMELLRALLSHHLVTYHSQQEMGEDRNE